MKKIKGIALGLSIIILIILNCINIFQIFTGKRASSLGFKNARLVVTVVEAQTGEPIQNATVCVVESRSYYVTNKYGMTKRFEVPILMNTNFDNSAKRYWGEITLLVYKNGYNNHIVFYVRVIENQTRVGKIVELSPIINSESKTEVSMEEPEDDGIDVLITHYKKK